MTVYNELILPYSTSASVARAKKMTRLLSSVNKSVWLIAHNGIVTGRVECVLKCRMSLLSILEHLHAAGAYCDDVSETPMRWTVTAPNT